MAAAPGKAAAGAMADRGVAAVDRGAAAPWEEAEAGVAAGAVEEAGTTAAR